MVFPYRSFNDRTYVANLKGFQNLAGLKHHNEMNTLDENGVYHIYNRGINSDWIFHTDENKAYFVRLMQKHLQGKCSILAYCLMNNHFHIALRVLVDGKQATQSLSNFFNAYAKAFNKGTGRTGSLFEKNFRRKKIENKSYCRRVIAYIHSNPMAFRGDTYKEYPFSSFRHILSGRRDLVNCDETLKVFGGLTAFIEWHNNPQPKIDII